MNNKTKEIAKQIKGVRALIDLALAEEPTVSQRKEISKLFPFLGFLEGDPKQTVILRTVVTDLRKRALPGGDLDVAAGAWLALAENGGVA
jgi:hypothetical protein